MVVEELVRSPATMAEVGTGASTVQPIDQLLTGFGPKSRVVFGAVPSFQEAKEATQDLNQALDKVYSSSLDSFESNLGLPSNCEPETNSSSIIETGPQYSVSKHAFQAFRLLQESTEAQTVVTSMASDPAVWNAMMENEDLKSFLRSRPNNKGLQLKELTEEFKYAHGASNIFSNMFQHLKTKIVDMAANASSFLKKVFGFSVSGGDKATSGAAASIDLMGVVILVILIVVLKRI